MRYEIEFTDEADEEFSALRPFERAIILKAIETSLRHEPMVISKNRKPVLPVGVVGEMGITWELRVGGFRIYYDVEPPALVVVIRIVSKGRQTTEGSLK